MMNMWKRPALLLIVIIAISSAFAKPGIGDISQPNPVVEVVKNVREAVVQIRVESTVTVQNNFRNPFMDDPFFRQFFGQPQEQSRPIVSMGSGFVYEYIPTTREAFIMTNNHVVEKGREGTITVTMADKITYTASVVGLDPNTDVAVIKITIKEGEKVTVAPLGDSDKLDIGEWAIAIGNPFSEGLDRTVTVGVISATSRADLNLGNNSPMYQDYIQTDAAINSGNSGGPLLNIKGEVIGINSALASNNGGNVGIGFAIPINLARRVVDDLVASGKVTRAYIGILPQEITSDIMESFQLKEVSGVLVAKVEKDSPADKAGLKVGD
ncbi:MAG: trypsin-like peptidase domain-containing protein, partial [Candidatus Cloacimonetes bacterium]|nr:trypsin-like peptidase domain-containing protein [Candidatus Cloacimonadota bacterium]